MIKSIVNGFLSDKSGKLFLISTLLLMISNVLISSNIHVALLGPISVVFYMVSLIYYSRYLELEAWVTFILVALALIPLGIWITLFYFIRKNYYIYHLEE